MGKIITEVPSNRVISPPFSPETYFHEISLRYTYFVHGGEVYNKVVSMLAWSFLASANI